MFKKYAQKICCTKTIKKRIPILEWLPNYNLKTFIQDTIAGITVGLTAIAQGMAYAIVAGLPPEYGLYACLMGGFIYMFFGRCKDASIGPTAILSALIARYISGYNLDFAILAAFLAGIIELSMGILHLGFLVQYISKPVISGFTTAASFQIITSQFKSLIGHTGPPGNYFIESVESFVRYVDTANIWDALLGILMMITLVAMQHFGQGCEKSKSILKQIRWYVSLSRNALVVLLGIILTSCLSATGVGEPLTVVGNITRGLPQFQMPPFSTVVDNETYSFVDMLYALGPQSIALPFVSVLEIVAISRAFSDGVTLDSSQEMIALGLCNIVGSFVGSMPITSSFARGALNRASGSQTPAGGIFTGFLIMLALSLLTSTFYFIPKAVLAAMIIVAMYSLINFPIFGKLWRESKIEFLVMLVTMFVCLCMGLEYGIVVGVLLQAIILMYGQSKPYVEVTCIKSEKADVILVQLSDNLSYCAADHMRRAILRAPSFATQNSTVVIEGGFVKRMDYTIATSIMSVVKDLEKKEFNVLLANFGEDIKSLILDGCEDHTKFVTALNTTELISIVNNISVPIIPVAIIK